MSADECTAGHTFTPENTRTRPDGRRDCRACDRARSNARREAKGDTRSAASWEAKREGDRLRSQWRQVEKWVYRLGDVMGFKVVP